MGDEEWKAKVRSITDPYEPLACIVENENFLGYGPYYKDLRVVLLEQADKVSRSDSL